MNHFNEPSTNDNEAYAHSFLAFVNRWFSQGRISREVNVTYREKSHNIDRVHRFFSKQPANSAASQSLSLINIQLHQKRHQLVKM